MYRIIIAIALWVAFLGMSSAQVTCQKVGQQTYCSSGQTLQRFGNTTYDGQGHAWQQSGTSTTSADGTTYQQSGNQITNNKGVSLQSFGNKTLNSNGTVYLDSGTGANVSQGFAPGTNGMFFCNPVGNQIFCNPAAAKAGPRTASRKDQNQELPHWPRPPQPPSEPDTNEDLGPLSPHPLPFIPDTGKGVPGG